MATTAPGQSDATLLRLLDCIAKDGMCSQRLLAAEVGIALGLVNAYVRRCVQKGLLKVREAPAKRYAYYLTPLGFAEKTRLTAAYLSSSFSLFRGAKAEMADLLRDIHQRGFTHVALLGMSEFAEIAVVCSYDGPVKIAAIVDQSSKRTQFLGVPVVGPNSPLLKLCDAAIVTDIANANRSAAKAAVRWSADRVFAPALICLCLSADSAVDKHDVPARAEMAL